MSTDLIRIPEAARIAGVAESTWRAYVSRRHPRGNPVPQPVEHVGVTPRWSRKEVQQWADNRAGRGARTDIMRGYTTQRARQAFAAAGGDPEDAGALAEWAHRALASRRTKAGVLVGEDGTILAETITRGGDSKVRYVESVADAAHDGVVGLAIDLAAARLRRLTGQGVVHVAYWEVCQGQGVG